MIPSLRLPLLFSLLLLLLHSIHASLAQTTHTGKATFYSATGLGHCSYPTPSSDLYVALSSEMYASASLCGSCIKVWAGEEDSSTHLILPVVDECPTCDTHQIDMSTTAFGHLASLSLGILQIQWRPIPCPSHHHPLTLSSTPALQVQIHQDSSDNYLALRIAGSPLPILRVHIAAQDQPWDSLTHTPNNYWVATHGLGPGPFSLRLALEDQIDLEIKNIPLHPGQLISRAVQSMEDLLAVAPPIDSLSITHSSVINQTLAQAAIEFLRSYPNQTIQAASVNTTAAVESLAISIISTSATFILLPLLYLSLYIA